MKETTLKTYRLPLLYSVVLHAALFLFVFTHSPDSDKQAQSGAGSQIAAPAPLPQAPIKATSVDSQAVESEIAKIRQREEQEAALRQQEFQKLQQAKTKAQQAQEEYKKIQAAKQQLQKEIQKNKILAEQQKKEALAEQKKAEKAKQEIAALKKKQAAEAAELKKQQQAAAELKKKELERAEARKKEKEAEDTTASKSEVDEETSKKRLEEEALASEEGLAEIEKPSAEKKNSQNPNSDTLTDQQLSEIDKYRQLITQSIGQNWIVPDNVDKHLSCELIIRVAPGGAVLNVTLAKSSGNPTLDRSAQTAVMKASPLPVPNSDSELFNQFRELKLTVRPEDF